jgi:hypothetical protein
MTQYLLSVFPTAEGAIQPAESELEALYAQVDRFNERLRAEGAWVFAGGLHEPGTATVVRVQDGKVLTTDGPFAETKEYLGGFWIIEARDLDAALAWAAAGAEACGAPVEVRPFQDEQEA